MSERVTIDRRFNGPPDSANGGYACGLVAGVVAPTGAAEVTLRSPPPLDRPLAVERRDGGRVSLRDGETLVAEAEPASLELAVPAPVSLDEAREASKGYLGFQEHTFPTCLVCGPERPEGDGLRIFPGSVDGRGIVAAPWTPTMSLAGVDSAVRPEFVWAALDCPGGWALARIESREPVVLGRMAARVIASVPADEPHVVIAWPLGAEGRRSYSGTALFSAAGELRAVARATWVRLK